MKTKKMTLQMFATTVNVKSQLSKKEMKRLKGGDGQGSDLSTNTPKIYIKE